MPRGLEARRWNHNFEWFDAINCVSISPPSVCGILTSNNTQASNYTEEISPSRAVRARFGIENKSKKVVDPETFAMFLRLTSERHDRLAWWINMISTTKRPPVVQDLRNHSEEQLIELRMLLEQGAPTKPDPRRPGFFELAGPHNVFYIFKYPTGTKVLLLGIWERDLVAEMVDCACSCSAA